jgi:hypothetical protein
MREPGRHTGRWLAPFRAARSKSDRYPGKSGFSPRLCRGYFSTVLQGPDQTPGEAGGYPQFRSRKPLVIYGRLFASARRLSGRPAAD